jgi:hypothetical protein
MTEPVPLPVQRLPKQTLHHAWAPKLRRPVMFASVAQVRLWVMLEANANVTNYCERPALSLEHAADPVADFWVMRDGTEQWLILHDDVDGPGAHAQQVAHSTTRTAPCVETISSKEMERHRIWIQNWMSLLPYLATGSHLVDPALCANVIQFFDRPATFAEAEQHFSRIDPVLVWTAVIVELHAGQLISADLIRLPLSRHTRVSRYRRGGTREA